MTNKKIHIIDLDDGPDGGGGASLAALLSKRGVDHQCWTSVATDSGWTRSQNVRCVDDSTLLRAIVKADNNDVFVPATNAAINWLDRLHEATEKDFPRHLDRILRQPRGVKSLLAAADADLPVADHDIWDETPDRVELSKSFHGGWILSDEGLLLAVGDGEEAWYRIANLMRKKQKRCALIPALGNQLYLGAHFIADKQVTHSTFVRVDSMRPAWRPALGRTVFGRAWQRASEEINHLNVHFGFLQSLWLYGPKQKKARFVASLPVPPAWLAIDEDGWAQALAGSKDLRLTPSGRYYADAPIDRSITPHTLLERTAQ